MIEDLDNLPRFEKFPAGKRIPVKYIARNGCGQMVAVDEDGRLYDCQLVGGRDMHPSELDPLSLMSSVLVTLGVLSRSKSEAFSRQMGEKRAAEDFERKREKADSLMRDLGIPITDDSRDRIMACIS